MRRTSDCLSPNRLSLLFRLGLLVFIPALFVFLIIVFIFFIVIFVVLIFLTRLTGDFATIVGEFELYLDRAQSMFRVCFMYQLKRHNNLDLRTK